MKRLMTLAIIIMVSTATASAQFVQVNYNSRNSSEYQNNKKDLRELRNFEHQLDKFSYLLMVEDLHRARMVKKIILEDMSREIRQSRRKLRQLDRSIDRNEHRKYRGEIYSKRNGRAGKRAYFEAKVLADRLAYQEMLRDEFRDTRLITRNRRKVFANKHRNLMYDFRDTMRDELGEERDQRRQKPRYKNRRG